MKPLRILAADDEVLALRRIRRLVDEVAGVEYVGGAESCGEALRKIQDLRPDVLLLDISMRDGSGFDVIERLSVDRMPAVIFVSAFDHFAIRAFEMSVVDYVLKPVELTRLKDAIERARSRLAERNAEQQLEEMRSVVASLREGMREQAAPRFETELWIRKSNGGFSRVAVDSIRWVESEEDYVRVHTAQGSYLMRGSIRRLEGRIDPRKFARVHRRTLVRVDEIAELSSPGFGQLQVRLNDGQALPVGRVYAKQLRQLMTKTLPPNPTRLDQLHALNAAAS